MPTSAAQYAVSEYVCTLADPVAYRHVIRYPIRLDSGQNRRLAKCVWQI
ncbi:MAG: hypothetical protein QM811_16925 [Pirellulales bacterium]